MAATPDEGLIGVRSGACACGALRVHCFGDPIRVSVCHCLDCQRRTGSAFAAQAHWPSDSVRTEGNAQMFERRGESGRWAKFFFCPTCGSTVFYEIEARPAMISTPLGVFAGSDPISPGSSVWETRKLPWVTLDARIEPFD